MLRKLADACRALSLILPIAAADPFAVFASFCNNEQVNCLDEFVRVTKKGGHICLMFRHDGYPTYQAKVESLIASGAWELVDKSESMRNFAATDSEEAAQVMYNIWSFRKC